MSYCADTSCFLEGWVRSYPVEAFPRLWEEIELLIARGRLFSPDEVKRELERKADALLDWAKQQEGLFQPLDGEVQGAAREILARFPRLVDTRRPRSGADPFVIAMAKVRRACVITQETYSNAPDRPRIPDVCDAFGVPHMNLLGLIRAERWTF